MRFSIISTTLAFVLSVNAATLNKRAVTASTQTCIDDLVAVNAQLLINNGQIAAFTAALKLEGALTLQNQEQALEANLTTAGTDCCSITGTISDEDSQALLPAISTAVSSALDEFNLIISKKAEYEALTLNVIPVLARDLANNHDLASKLSTCLIASAPSSGLTATQGYADQLENAFQNIIAIFPQNTTTIDTNTAISAINAVAAELVSA